MLSMQLARSSPRFKELYLPNDMLKITNAYDLKPSYKSIAAQLTRYSSLGTIRGIKQEDMSKVRQTMSNGGLWSSVTFLTSFQLSGCSWLAFGLHHVLAIPALSV
jgi:hypothetical protein